MKLQQLKFKLKLHPHPVKSEPAQAGLTKAAVLIPIIENKDEKLEIWLTQRPTHLKHHPGQISFPGGKLETQDSSLWHCAIRETEEEIGIDATSWRSLSTLSNLNTLTGFQIFPFIAVNQVQSEQVNIQLNQNEVDCLIKLPLNFLLYQSKIQTIHLHRHNNQHEVYGFYYQDKFIWGATAAILRELKSRLL